jgi:hypothetical protein
MDIEDLFLTIARGDKSMLSHMQHGVNFTPAPAPAAGRFVAGAGPFAGRRE